MYGNSTWGSMLAIQGMKSAFMVWCTIRDNIEISFENQIFADHSVIKSYGLPICLSFLFYELFKMLVIWNMNIILLHKFMIHMWSHTWV